MRHNEYDLAEAFQRIENELMASMIRNMDRHRAEETEEGYNWSMWQAEQLKALEKYKRNNQRKYRKQFKNINNQIEELIRQARQTGNMQQEIRILQAIKNSDFSLCNHKCKMAGCKDFPFYSDVYFRIQESQQKRWLEQR